MIKQCVLSLLIEIPVEINYMWVKLSSSSQFYAGPKEASFIIWPGWRAQISLLYLLSLSFFPFFSHFFFFLTLDVFPILFINTPKSILNIISGILEDNLFYYFLNPFKFYILVFRQWLSGKESACNAGDSCLIPGLGRSFGEGNGNPIHYSWLENPMDRGAWQVAHGVTKRIRHNLTTKPPSGNTISNRKSITWFWERK